jgi:hypothetical protein
MDEKTSGGGLGQHERPALSRLRQPGLDSNRRVIRGCPSGIRRAAPGGSGVLRVMHAIRERVRVVSSEGW